MTTTERRSLIVAGDDRSSVILHVPHASWAIPSDVRAALTLSDEQLHAELSACTDTGTDLLAAIGADAAGIRPWLIVNDLSRLVVDPERFPDNREEMEAVGRGAVYTHTSAGEVMRDLSADDWADLIDTYFRPYSAAVSATVADRLAATGAAVVIDVHSYPAERAGYELQPTSFRPHLCIGTDATHTPRWLSEAAQAAFSEVGTIGENTPYAGCYVPLDRYGTDPRVSAVMLEIRRDRYLDDHGAVRPTAAEALGAMIGRFTDAAERGWR